jgi:bifunctional UDP-N-acetylglucosamine pyrophosphorylase/glucosamine-1-phosphate N-acetyltransferase
MPFITPDTIEHLINAHKKSNSVLTLITVTVPDFEEWRSPFYSFGRIVRNSLGAVTSTVEFKDCTEEQKKITELNPCYYCFDAKWLWENLEQIGKENAQGEYYLTDLVGIATRHGDRIETISADPKVAVGVNTVEQLEKASALI